MPIIIKVTDNTLKQHAAPHAAAIPRYPSLIAYTVLHLSLPVQLDIVQSIKPLCSRSGQDFTEVFLPALKLSLFLSHSFLQQA